MVNIQFLKESKITKGDEITLTMPIGNFKKDDQLTVIDIKPNGDDIEVHLQNNKGIKDILYMDKTENLEDLNF